MYGGVGGQCKFLGKESEWDERKYMQAKVPRNQRQMFLEQLQFARSCSRASVRQQRATCLLVQMYLHYWYKSTNADAARVHVCINRAIRTFFNSFFSLFICINRALHKLLKQLLICQYLYFCTRTASKLSTRGHVCLNRTLRKLLKADRRVDRRGRDKRERDTRERETRERDWTKPSLPGCNLI